MKTFRPILALAGIITLILLLAPGSTTNALACVALVWLIISLLFLLSLCWAASDSRDGAAAEADATACHVYSCRWCGSIYHGPPHCTAPVCDACTVDARRELAALNETLSQFPSIPHNTPNTHRNGSARQPKKTRQ